MSIYLINPCKSSLPEKVKDLENEVETINGEIETINGEIETVNGEITSLNERVDAVEEVLPSLGNLKIFENGITYTQTNPGTSGNRYTVTISEETVGEIIDYCIGNEKKIVAIVLNQEQSESAPNSKTYLIFNVVSSMEIEGMRMVMLTSNNVGAFYQGGQAEAPNLVLAGVQETSFTFGEILNLGTIDVRDYENNVKPEVASNTNSISNINTEMQRRRIDYINTTINSSNNTWSGNLTINFSGLPSYFSENGQYKKMKITPSWDSAKTIESYYSIKDGFENSYTYYFQISPTEILMIDIVISENSILSSTYEYKNLIGTLYNHRVNFEMKNQPGTGLKYTLNFEFYDDSSTPLDADSLITYFRNKTGASGLVNKFSVNGFYTDGTDDFMINGINVQVISAAVSCTLYGINLATMSYASVSISGTTLDNPIDYAVDVVTPL